MFSSRVEKAALGRAVQKFITFSRRVPQILSKQAKGLYKIDIFHCLRTVLKSLFDVSNLFHNPNDLFSGEGGVSRRQSSSYQRLIR